jgi:hypothetical protein
MEFREIILPGAFLSDGTFSLIEFRTILIDIPKEFSNAAWGYGLHYGQFYGRGV